MRELSGLWKFKVRRFGIIYELDRKARIIRIFAIGHRREVYEELADRVRDLARNK
jgi:mRNA-degrading endonuclease RelE of RelBE toxin-antitoxin system